MYGPGKSVMSTSAFPLTGISLHLMEKLLLVAIFSLENCAIPNCQNETTTKGTNIFTAFLWKQCGTVFPEGLFPYEQGKLPLFHIMGQTFYLTIDLTRESNLRKKNKSQYQEH